MRWRNSREPLLFRLVTIESPLCALTATLLVFLCAVTPLAPAWAAVVDTQNVPLVETSQSPGTAIGEVVTNGGVTESSAVSGPYPKVSTLVNNFSTSPVKATANFFLSVHGKVEILQGLIGALGSLLVELRKLQQALPPQENVSVQSGKKYRRKNKKGDFEIVYKPNMVWLWQAYIFLSIFPFFGILFSDKKDPLVVALIISLLLIFLIFFSVARFSGFILKKGQLIQKDFFIKKINVEEVKRIEIFNYGIFGGVTYVVSEKLRISISHTFFDQETRKELLKDLIRINNKISFYRM